ncbi:hypothetical protein NPIL_136901, partial [Nephila pilipes]
MFNHSGEQQYHHGRVATYPYKWDMALVAVMNCTVTLEWEAAFSKQS